MTRLVLGIATLKKMEGWVVACGSGGESRNEEKGGPTYSPAPTLLPSTAGVNGNWKSELTVTWALGDPEPMRGLVSPSCSLVVIAGRATARCCPEGRRASCPGKEESGRSRPLSPDRLVGAERCESCRRQRPERV